MNQRSTNNRHTGRMWRGHTSQRRWTQIRNKRTSLMVSNGNESGSGMNLHQVWKNPLCLEHLEKEKCLLGGMDKWVFQTVTIRCLWQRMGGKAFG